LLDYSMKLSGCNFTLAIELPDSTAPLSKVLTIIANNDVSVHDVTFDRTGADSALGHVRVFIQCLSRNFEQQQKVLRILEGEGYTMEFKSPKIQHLSPAVSDQTRDKLESSALSKPVPVTEYQPPPLHDISQVTPDSIRNAYHRIKSSMLPTPTYFDRSYSELCGCKVYLKFENTQKTGSFKVGDLFAFGSQMESNRRFDRSVAPLIWF